MSCRENEEKTSTFGKPGSSDDLVIDGLGSIFFDAVICEHNIGLVCASSCQMLHLVVLWQSQKRLNLQVI